MRCAALHRKLGTHVSKVKSLSMDSWSLDQVEVWRISSAKVVVYSCFQNIKKVGNVASNRRYNPRNAKPTIPVDADEVDGAMERYIREKYLHRTLSDEKPLSPQGTRQHTGSSSSSNDVPPPLPPKPNQRFGGTNRSATSPFPRMDAPLPSPPASVKTDRTGASSGETRRMARIPETEPSSARGSFEFELRSLRDMGFRDDRKSIAVLQNFNGDLGRTIDTLARLRDGGSINNSTDQIQPQTNGISFEKPRSRSNSALTNGISRGQTPSQLATSTNPFMSSRSLSRASSNPQPLDTSLQNLQLSQSSLSQNNPSTGQNQLSARSATNTQNTPMSPPIFPMHYTHPNTTQSVGSSPQNQYHPIFSGPGYPLRQSRSQQNFATSNPFASNVLNGTSQFTHQPQQQVQTAQAQQWSQQKASPQQAFGFQTQQQYSAPPSTTQSMFQSNPYQQQSQQQLLVQSPPPVENNPYVQSQQQQGGYTSYLPSNNANQYQQQNGFQDQYYPQFSAQQPQQYQQPSQPQSLRPQATGLDKASILALYNAPSPAFAQSSTASLASTSNSTDISTQNMYAHSQMPPHTQQLAPPSQEGIRPVPIQARSVTMPLPNAPSYQNGSMDHSNNPFAKGHVSRESMLFTGAGNGGRTSPDAFTGLSARVGWTG